MYWKWNKKLHNILNKSKINKENLKKWIVEIIEDFNIFTIFEISLLCQDEIDNINLLLKELDKEPFNSYAVSRFLKIGKPYN